MNSVQSRIACLLIPAVVAVSCAKKAEAPPPAPAVVTIAEVVRQDVPLYQENIGQTRGSSNIEVRARTQGFLEGRHFTEGTRVEKGQLLFTIDPRESRTQLAQAQGGLASAEAAYVRATQDVERFKPLVEQNAIPRREYETALANQAAAKAQVESAKAQVDRSAITVGFTKVYAPITGLIGAAEVGVGSLVGAGQATLLATISRLDPVVVRFSISEREYLEYFRKYGKRAMENDPASGIEMILADGSVHPHKGHLTFADRIIDPQTGTLMLEAEFPNPGGMVRFGQYARVRFAVDTLKDAILVPQRAIQELQATFTVAVVNGSKVEIRPVVPGARIGSMRVIEQGLKPGEKVVVEGLQKVANGMEVKATLVDAAAAEAPAAAAAAPAGEPEKEKSNG